MGLSAAKSILSSPMRTRSSTCGGRAHLVRRSRLPVGSQLFNTNVTLPKGIGTM
jgi:hypothetical protein